MEFQNALGSRPRAAIKLFTDVKQRNEGSYKKKRGNNNNNHPLVRLLQDGGLLELLPGTPHADFTSHPENNAINTEDATREELPENGRALFLYQRPQPEERLESLPSSLSRVACIYTGFLRDFGRMVQDCDGDHCNGDVKKLFGFHRSRLWKPSKCDVFMTTWHHHGVGSYKQLQFDPATSPPIDVTKVMEVIGDALHTLHVQNYTLYEPIFKTMARHSRVFQGHHVREGKLVRKYMRFNDYSQAYKLHVGWKLLVSPHAQRYDCFVRVRPDV
eukprot:PhF_6_TR9257/c0_g1_i2/m.14662